MQFMVLVKATRDSEAGVMPREQMFAEMGRFNEQLVQAGVMVGGGGLHPSQRAARVRFSGAEPEVVAGPFAEVGTLVSGYWLWNCASLDEAIGWARRCPFPLHGDNELEIRQVMGAEDFGEAFTPELREKEEQLRQALEKQGRG